MKHYLELDCYFEEDEDVTEHYQMAADLGVKLQSGVTVGSDVMIVELEDEDLKEPRPGLIEYLEHAGYLGECSGNDSFEEVLDLYGFEEEEE